MEIAYSGGTKEVSVGDVFFTRSGTKPGRYTIEALHGLEERNDFGAPEAGGQVRSTSSYSPSALGGTPTIGCRNVRTGEVVDFCGDSLAALLANPQREPDGWDEEEQRRHNREIYK